MFIFSTIKKGITNRAYKSRVRSAFGEFYYCTRIIERKIEEIKKWYKEGKDYSSKRVEVSFLFGKMELQVDILLNLHSHISLLNSKNSRIKEVFRIRDKNTDYLLTKLYNSVFIVENVNKAVKNKVPFTNENIVNAIKALNSELERVFNEYDNHYSEDLKIEVDIYNEVQLLEKAREETIKQLMLNTTAKEK